MKPKVSICLPNLNTLPFLAERFETIFSQTLGDWELLVYDSYSDDGAWEYIQGLAEKEPRMRAWQGPREGTPGSWSPCVKQAQGEYVLVATSDDTMPPNFLEKMVEALDAHPECGLAHCMLRAIDTAGNDVEGINGWWAGRSLIATCSEGLLEQPHVRKAPYDGLLHLLGETVYISITQLLIRRDMFDKVGLFESTWGAPGDFAWDMRAGLVADTVHVPETWGGWRLHPGQATDSGMMRSVEHGEKIDRMIEAVVAGCGSFLEDPVRDLLVNTWAKAAEDFREFHREKARRSGALSRRGFICKELLKGSAAARNHLSSKLLGRQTWLTAGPELVRRWLEDAGMWPGIVAEHKAPEPPTPGEPAQTTSPG